MDNPEITTLILRFNPELINKFSKINQTPIHIACSKNKVENLKILFSSTDLDLKCIDNNGSTLLLKACSAMSYDAAEFLIKNVEKHNLLINNVDNNGYTALHYTMEDNNLKLSLELLELGARYDIKNNEGFICFSLMKDSNMREIIYNYIENKN